MKTNLNLLTLTLAVAFVGLISWGTLAQGGVDISDISPANGSEIINGSTVTVSANVVPDAGVSLLGVYLAFSWEGSSYTTNQMINISGNAYQAVIPRLAAGAIDHYIFARYTDGAVTNDFTSADTAYEISETLLDPLRATDFELASGWLPSVTSSFGHTNKVGETPETWWLGDNTYWPINLSGTAPRAPGSTGMVMGLRPMIGAFIRSPLLADGVGTVYYNSVMDADDYGGEMVIQYSTHDTADIPENSWVTVREVKLVPAYPRSKESDFVVVNNPDARFVRFLRTDSGSHSKGWSFTPDGKFARILLDNLYFSQPPTSIIISEELHNPGYPAQDQDVKVRCRVTDIYQDYPSINREVQVFYSWESENGPWTATNMYQIADDVYEGVIVKHQVGRMYYYFRCDYDGYFYSRDPDGVQEEEPWHGPKGVHDEDLSPAFLVEKGDDNYRNYEIRRFRSDVKMMRVLANPPEATVEMELIDDNHWQGLTLVTGITNLTWQFEGTGGYVDDAAAYDPSPWLWGDNDQDFPNPPIAGWAEQNATNPIVAEMEYDGFLVIRMNHNDDVNDYLAKRAVYQNFNIWTAHPEEFEESTGLYSIKTFREEFNSSDWQFDAYEPAKTKIESVDSTGVTDFVSGTPGRTFNWWMYDNARIVKELDVWDADLLSFVPRRAVELGNKPLLSRVWNTYASKTLGIDTFSFKGRLSLNDNHFSFFTGKPNLNPFVDGDAAWPRTQAIEIVGRAAANSPGHVYLSIITWLQLYEDGYDYKPSYYEVRFIQSDSTDNRYERLNIEAYRWKNGVATKVGTTTFSNQASGRALNMRKMIRVEMSQHSNGNIQITPRVHFDSHAGLAPNSYTWKPGTITDSSADKLQRGGTFGFTSFDASMEVERVRVFAEGKYVKADNLLGIEHWGSGSDGGLQNYWYMGGKRSADNQNRWKTDGNNLVRDVPTQHVGLYVAPMADGQPMQPNLDEVFVTQREVSSLGYGSFSIPLKLWNQSFVVLKNMGSSEMNVVLDDLTLTPWRAVTRSDVTRPNTEERYGGVNYYDWTAKQQEEWSLLATNQGWLVMEGWVNSSAGSRGGEVQFDRSRANTNLVQALYAPYMTNNIGSIAFDWRASATGDVVFAIERTAAGSSTTWETVKAVTNVALAGKEFVPMRKDFPGRIRIRVAEGTKAQGVLKLDNFIARDNPAKDDTSWEAYNALITEGQKSRAFEPTVPGAQTAYLNNSTTIGVAVNETQAEHLAFVQTPKVGTGIGEVAFWYRIWDEEGGPAVLSLQIAAHADVPDNQWITLTNIIVEADQTEWTYFSDGKIFQPDHKVLRLYCMTNYQGIAGNRICIDNVLMTEPVRGGFDFMSVSPWPVEQPVVGTPSGLEVTIGRFIMNPTDIHIYVSYTNSPFTSIIDNTARWGYTNWWNKSGPKLELVEVEPRTYRLPEGVNLPATAIDDVVQYIVWGTHADIKDETDPPIIQDEESFTNPEWYYPVDLNERPSDLNPAGKGAQGWSPYYFVYSCPPYSVWVNEIDYGSTVAAREFFEIIGPAGASLANWEIKMLTTDNATYRTPLLLPSGLVLNNVYKGWGFIVWGDPNVEGMVSPEVHYWLLPAGGPGVNVPPAGGVRITRSNGSWEDQVAWGSAAEESLVADYGFKYAGYKKAGYALAKTSVAGSEGDDGEIEPGDRSYDFSWLELAATHGEVNLFQELIDVTPEVSFFTIYSVIEGFGAHDAGPNTFESFTIDAGETATIVYTADEWYRIESVLSNDTPVGEASGSKSFTLTLSDVQGDISNHVIFVEADAEQVGISSNVPLDWVKGYYSDNEAAAAADENLADDYLLGVDPRDEYDVALVISAIVVTDDVVVTVKLTDGAMPLATTINGTLRVYGKMSLGDNGWAPVGSAAVISADFNSSGLCEVGPFDPQGFRFFKAVIE